MTGETDLNKLLESMSPILMDKDYVFISFADAHYGDYTELKPIASIVETEGLTLLIPQARADHFELSYDATFRGITLKVHSSLEAIGLTAALCNKLTEHALSANVIAGYYHDHIFVQSEFAETALSALIELT